MSKTTRIYEVPAEPKQAPSTEYNRIYLIDATSKSAAWNFVAAKYVGAPDLPNGRRVAELMGPPNSVKVEVAQEETT